MTEKYMMTDKQKAEFYRIVRQQGANVQELKKHLKQINMENMEDA